MALSKHFEEPWNHAICASHKIHKHTDTLLSPIVFLPPTWLPSLHFTLCFPTLRPNSPHLSLFPTPRCRLRPHLGYPAPPFRGTRIDLPGLLFRLLETFLLIAPFTLLLARLQWHSLEPDSPSCSLAKTRKFILCIFNLSFLKSLLQFFCRFTWIVFLISMLLYLFKHLLIFIILILNIQPLF